MTHQLAAHWRASFPSSQQLFRQHKHPAEPHGNRSACCTLELHFTGTVFKCIAHRFLSNSSDGICQWPNLKSTLERHFTGTVFKGIAHRLPSNSSDGICQWPNLKCTLGGHFAGTVLKGSAHRLQSNSSDGICQWPNLKTGGQSSAR